VPGRWVTGGSSPSQVPPLAYRAAMARRIALISDTSAYVGPSLARLLAERGHDLVVGDPHDGLVAELESHGGRVVAVDGVRDLAREASGPTLVSAALDAFGRLDAAAFFSGKVIVGPFLDADAEQLAQVVRGNLEAPFRMLQALLEPMLAQGSGQILAITSAAGLRVTPGAPLYSATRAGANMLVRNVAAEVAPRGIQVNAVGTNFMDFPGFLEANRATEPEGRARVEGRVPMRRLGQLDEFAAFCAVFVDGTSGFQTGQVVGYDGGWSA
jgi:NAD(P)-dependent dehydrogenase (short-subunit alcohol dehydrogenase family)